MQSGKLNTRIQIQGETISRDSYGQETISWGVIHTVQAKKSKYSSINNWWLGIMSKKE